MSCEELRAGRLSDEECERHLQSCEACADEQERLLRDLPAWEVPQPSPTLVARTMARIRAEQPAAPSWWARVDLALQRFGSHRPTRLTGFATLMVTCLLLGKVLSPNLWRGRSGGAEVACQRNVQILEQALQRYAQEHSGTYPPHLRELRGDYVNQVPECPDSATVTYENGYAVSPDGRRFTLTCTDTRHAR